MILVTGASGSNGSELIKQLSATGASVRAMVRKRRDLENGALPGVEFVPADFDDLAGVNRALEGVQSAFLVTNSSERTETQQLRFVEAARAGGLRHIVYLSQLRATKDSPLREIISRRFRSEIGSGLLNAISQRTGANKRVAVSAVRHGFVRVAALRDDSTPSEDKKLGD
jgi:nucleoside-diphosphate-sugar epimerase